MALGRSFRAIQDRRTPKPQARSLQSGVSDVSWDEVLRYLDRPTSGQPLTLPAVGRAVEILAHVVGAMPLGAFDQAGRRQPSVLDDLGGALWTRADFVRYVVRCQLLAGDFYALPRQGQWYPIHPSRVTVYAVYSPDDGRLLDRLYKVSPPNVQASSSFLDSLRQIDQGRARVYSAADMELIHVPGADFDGIKGVSKIQAYRRSLDTMSMVEETTHDIYANTAMPSGFLMSERTLKPEQAETMKRRWQEKINTGEVAVIDGGVTFQPISISPVDAELLASRRFGVEDVARVFGVPSVMLNEVGSGFMAGAGVDALNAFFLTQTIEPILDQIEEWFSKWLPGALVARFDRTLLTKPEPKTRGQFLMLHRQMQTMSINEAREREGLHRIEDPRADDPFYAPPKVAADEVGGNPGTHGGGTDAQVAPTA